ncbi:MAG: hypothetical protein EPO39_17285 [Candidatus Manganitrophaceae bacterium]|nr:MAG: hypothetical protein EPO39_17285 [Candidatus Manganitrophaceae bacterium]
MEKVVQSQEKRARQRRDETEDRRQGDRRQGDRRQGARRAIERRKESCPVCSSELTPKLFCPSCKMKVIKIRN